LRRETGPGVDHHGLLQVGRGKRVARRDMGHPGVIGGDNPFRESKGCGCGAEALRKRGTSDREGEVMD
jgi:hypothetical protein